MAPQRQSITSQRKQSNEPPDWNAESEMDTTRQKFNIKRRYWKAAHNLGKKAVETSGAEVRDRRKENKELRKEWVELDNEENLKDIIFPTWKRQSYAYRNSSLDKNVHALDDAVLNQKKLHGKVMWEKKKKMDFYEKQEREWAEMKDIEDRLGKEMEKDDTMQQIKRFDNEIGLIKTKLEHSETVNKHYNKCVMIVRKGNQLMSQKLDYLECAAERIHRERWELYQIKTMSEYLKEDANKQQEERRSEVIRNRQKYDKNTTGIKEDIQHQVLSESLLSRIQGLDDQERELANKALKLLGKGLIKTTIVDRAKGPDALRGPRLRKLAFKIIRMKYEESMNSKMEQTLKQYSDLQACSCAETMDGILLAYKEQKDTTLYLRNVAGLLQTKWQVLIKSREDLKLRLDDLTANLSNDIDKFDDEGKAKHRLLHAEHDRKTDVRDVEDQSGRLVARVTGTLKSILCDLLTFKAKPKVGEVKKDSLEDLADNKLKHKRSQDSATYMRKSLETTTNPLDMVIPILSEMDNLLTFINGLSASRRAMLQARTKEYHGNFQTFLENAIYGSAHITKTTSSESMSSISDKRGSDAGAEDRSDKDGPHVLSREEMKELSQDVITTYENKFKQHDEVEVREKGNYHKYC